MKSKVAGFYTARTANMAALPWPNFAPPFSSYLIAGKLSHLPALPYRTTSGAVLE
mgnify:CR=1 FL=1